MGIMGRKWRKTHVFKCRQKLDEYQYLSKWEPVRAFGGVDAAHRYAYGYNLPVGSRVAVWSCGVYEITKRIEELRFKFKRIEPK